MEEFFDKITPEMHWFSNIEDHYLPTFRALADMVGLPYEEVRPAYTMNGEKLSNATGIFIPEEAYEKRLLTKYFQAVSEFSKQYKERLEKKGYDTTPLDYKQEIFFGCETYYDLELSKSNE